MERLPSLIVRGAILSRKLHQATRSLAFLRRPPRQPSSSNYTADYMLLLRINLCPNCFEIHQRLLHTSVVLASWSSKTSKKAEREKKNFKRTRPKLSNEAPVLIRENMTLEEIARGLNKDVEVPLQGTNDLLSCVVVERIEDIREICRLSGRKSVEEKKKEKVKENKDITKQPPPDPKKLVKRPPVVTIMGHVDHGKTTLLDALRHSNIVGGEFGGITQHIGAFSVKLKSGDTITFLDTPGHAAFSAMRSRGAQVTDIVVLVVAADDGVMEQTVQSVGFAQEANVPIIVAINKCDKPTADLDAAKRGLLSMSVTPEELGGDVQCIPISALKRQNLDELQDAIVVQSEVMELKGDPHGKVEAVVIESKVDQGKGKVSTALVQRGTLKKGIVLVSGTAMAKVKRLLDENGKSLKVAGPGTAAEIIGWRVLPHPGDEILEVESESRAREVIRWREDQIMERKMEGDKVIIEKKIQEHEAVYKKMRQSRLEKGLFRSRLFRSEKRTSEAVQLTTGPELSIVIRGDVDGSVEAILGTISTYNSRQCHLHIMSYDVGVVTEQDVETAAPFNGIIYAFNTKVPADVAKLAEDRDVKIKKHNVIYKLVEDLRKELIERLEPLKEEIIVGEANVLQAFKINVKRKDVPVAGCRCTSGMINKKKLFKLVRKDETLINGNIKSLKQLKNEVETIKNGVECGIMFEDSSTEPRPGDTIICYEIIEKPQKLEWDLHF